MSIQTEIDRIVQAKTDIISSIENGGQVPSGTKLDSLAEIINEMSSGGRNIVAGTVVKERA